MKLPLFKSRYGGLIFSIVMVILIILFSSFTSYYNQGTYNEKHIEENYEMTVIMYERLNGIQIIITPPEHKDLAYKRLKELAPNNKIIKEEIRDNKYFFILASLTPEGLYEKDKS